MTSLGVSYKLLRLHFKVPNMYRRITCCAKGSYALPHLISIGLPKAIQSFIIFFKTPLLDSFMYYFRRTYSALMMPKVRSIHMSTLIKPKNSRIFSLLFTKLFFYWEVTNSFLVDIGAVTNNYNPWWQQTKTSNCIN